MTIHDIYFIRRANLARLLAERGAAASLAESIDSTAAYISTLKSGDRHMGDEVARHIEEAKGLTPGWMDREHGRAMKLYCIEADTLDELAEELRGLGPEVLGEVFSKLIRPREEA